MQVGFSFAGTLSRPGAMPLTSQTTGEKTGGDDVAAGPVEGSNHYFRALSSISPGSLASAYQAIRAQAGAASATLPAGNESGGVPEMVILSGQGIPGAMRAYEDVIS